jgi:hypothetical protein
MWYYDREPVYENERAEFRERVEQLQAEARGERGYLPLVPLPERVQDSIDRVAISRACVALGYLCYRRKRIPIRVSDLKRRKIS